VSTPICSSMADDTLMEFEGRFKDYILPDKLHLLNVSFLVRALLTRATVQAFTFASLAEEAEQS
jgi:hypothetical protein